MGRGIISVKSANGSGTMSNGKVIVTNGKNVYGGGVATQQGASLNFKDLDLGTCNCGDIVDFTLTETTDANGVVTKTITQIVASPNIKNVPFVWDPTAPTDYTINATDAMFAVLGGEWSGNFIVNGGTLIITSDPSALPPAGTYNAFTGVVSAPQDGAAIVIDNQISIQKTSKIDSKSDVCIRNSQVEAKVAFVVTQKGHLIIRNSNIDGTVNVF